MKKRTILKSGKLKKAAILGLTGAMLSSGAHAKITRPDVVFETKNQVSRTAKNREIVDLENNRQRYINYLKFIPGGMYVSDKLAQTIISRAFIFGMTELEYTKSIKRELAFEFQKEEMLLILNKSFSKTPLRLKREWVERKFPSYRSHSVSDFNRVFNELIDELKVNPMLMPRELLDNIKNPNKNKEKKEKPKPDYIKNRPKRV